MADPTNIAVLAGGVGAARMLRGLIAAYPAAEITAIVNVADDEVLHGLSISPDIDTIMYTVSGEIDPERGWGLAGETWTAMASVRFYAEAAGRPDIGWFNLGDRDLGTHMYRSSRLAEGATLSEVTAEMTAAWKLPVSLVPVTDDRVATRLVTTDGELTFQEYFVREHHEVAVTQVRFAGAENAVAAPGVIELLDGAEVIVIAPSNPLISIGPVLAVPGVRDALARNRDRTVGVSPIIGGKALKGPADRLLAELGHESTALGVARIYRGLCAAFVIDEVDRDLAGEIEQLGLHCSACPSIMVDLEVAAALARTTIAAVLDGERTR